LQDAKELLLQALFLGGLRCGTIELAGIMKAPDKNQEPQMISSQLSE
jgi:hypothetical protein